METKDIGKPSLWIPMTDPRSVAVLTKLSEELAECVAAAQRCLMQGMHETEPTTGKPNIDWLREEIADVHAVLRLTINFFDLHTTEMSERERRKFAMKREWLQMLSTHFETK